jgi:hypothetical protein
MAHDSRLNLQVESQAVAVAVANKMARIAWAIMAKRDTIARRSSLQRPEEAWQWERVATAEQDNRIARVMMA